MTPEAPKKSVEELRVFVLQEANRWASAHLDAIATRLAVRGFAHGLCGSDQALWIDAFVLIEKLDQLAAVCVRNEVLMRQQLAALHAEQPDGERSEQLH